ncbi:MAG: GDSL-type esterase/lipase family protein [bacterium]
MKTRRKIKRLGLEIVSNWNIGISAFAMPTADRWEYWNNGVECLAGRIGVPACSLVRQLPGQHKQLASAKATADWSGTGEDAYTPRLTTRHPEKVTRSFIPALLAASLLLAFLAPMAFCAPAPKPFVDGERVLFLGDSITRGGGWYSMISLFYETRFPDRRITWLNAGISGDIAAGAVQRLQWDVLDRKPTTVVIMFGMNECGRTDLPGKLGSDERVALYRDNMIALVGKLKKANMNVVLCTPSPSEGTAKLVTEAKPEINAGLSRCSQAAREIADRFNLALVDFHGPMDRIAADFQKTNPSFTLIGNDRVHPGEIGCTVMGYLFLKAQGVTGVVSETVLDGATIIASAVTVSEKALPMPFEGKAREALHLSPDNELEKALKTLKNPNEAHRYPGWSCLPIQETLNRQMLCVTNLSAGEYELVIDDTLVGCWSQDALTKGVNLAGVRSTPQYRQALQVSKIHTQRHGQAGGNRGLAFTRLYTLEPAHVNMNDKAAVQAVLDRLINDSNATNNPSLGAGGFAQTMAKNYSKTLEKEAALAATSAAMEEELYKLNKPVPHRYCLRPVRHPIPVEQRQAAFAARHSPEQVEKTAKAFLDLLILDSPGLMRSNLRLRKGFQTVADLAKANKPVEALNAWRDYFFEKLRNPTAYGLPMESVDPYKGLLNPSVATQTIARAEELMQGKFVPDAKPVMPGMPATSAHDAAPMLPGTVWLPPPAGGAYGSANPWRPATFQPLAEAYLLTGERRFLDQWIAYMDDWAMFELADDNARPTDLPDLTNSFSGQIATVYRTLAGIVRMQPTRQTVFPADTLARILSKLIRVYPLPALVYFESNPQNWTPHTMPLLMASAAWMDEFKATEQFFNRARRRLENYGTNEGLPDGSETEHAVWYNRAFYGSNVEAVEFATARRNVPIYQRPTWESAISSLAWEQDRIRAATDRARYLLQMLTPQSQNPIGNRNDQRLIKGVTKDDEFDLYERAPDLRVLMDTLLGNTAAGVPSFTMSAFPYSGSWLMRTGWGKDAGYGHFFCSPYPTGGHGLPGMKSNNSFYLSLAGQDLLVNGGFGNYSYCRSPLRVDGLEQFAQAGLGHGGVGKSHKGFTVGYLDPQPPAWRAHSSTWIDLAEGIYEGPYGESGDDHHDDGVFTVAFLADRARSVLVGIRHHRQVIFVKDPGVWIVVDRLQSTQPHDYSLDWFMPVAPVREFEGKRKGRYSGKTFAPDKVVFDDAQQMLTAAGDGMPNVVIRHFGPRQTFGTLRIDGEAVKDDYTIGYKLYDFWRTSGSWKSTGNDVMISLVEVIPDGQKSRMAEIEKVAGGFRARTLSGETLRFTATQDGRDELKLGDRGLMLGEESYEFQGDKRIPIYCPIAPVKIAPARDVIAGPEAVTLTSATANVEIRYTLDGSEPTLQSPRYNGPFTINNTVTVQARAFRPGLVQMPGSLAGTHATVIAVANYKLQKPLEPVTGRTQPGLKAAYCEGDWKDLIFFPERVIPKQTTGVKNLFDRCVPNVEKVVGWTYSGYLAIPEDGVYTFHAPQELVTSRQEPGYALRLFVGQEMNGIARATGNLNEWYPASTRHAYGTWSIALKKGLHPFKVIYVDYRTDAVERLNHPGLKLNVMWDGAKPQVLVSGPGLLPSPIPVDWFCFVK